MSSPHGVNPNADRRNPYWDLGDKDYRKPPGYHPQCKCPQGHGHTVPEVLMNVETFEKFQGFRTGMPEEDWKCLMNRLIAENRDLKAENKDLIAQNIDLKDKLFILQGGMADKIEEERREAEEAGCWCDDHEQFMWKDGVQCSGCLEEGEPECGCVCECEPRCFHVMKAVK